MLVSLAFYLFSAILVGAAFMVVAGRNPVHSVLFLILAFFNAAALFVLLGAEFLAMILAVVYVGAVAVLFLFVVLVIELVMVASVWVISPAAPEAKAHLTPAHITNTAALGHILYTDYVFYF